MADSANGTNGAVKLVRFPLGKSRKPFTAVDRAAYTFRRLVEAELMTQPGGLTTVQAHRLATACRAFRAAARCHCLMAKLGSPPDGTLTIEQWVALQDREVRHSEAVDRALRDLGLSRDKSRDWIDELYRSQPAYPPAAPIDAGQAAATPDNLNVTEGNGVAPEHKESA
jgi:hypothetical protein